jgi:serine/threonine protein kinase
MLNLGFSKMNQKAELISVNDALSEITEYSSIEEYLDSYGIPDKMSFTDILVQMVEAVEEMHMHGFVHHDIKPGNFCINNNRVVLGYL